MSKAPAVEDGSYRVVLLDMLAQLADPRKPQRKRHKSWTGRSGRGCGHGRINRWTTWTITAAGIIENRVIESSIPRRTAHLALVYSHLGLFHHNGIHRIKEATEEICRDRNRALPLLLAT
jgi:hypothetical protein